MSAPPSPPDHPTPDIYFAPIPDRIIPVMFDLAAVRSDDVVYDLGCGDARILLAAVRDRGARAVGIDLDVALLDEARRRFRAASLEDRVNLIHGDMFACDLRPANVVTLYLLDSLNVRLRPRILAQCRPGTRVVSYSFEMGDWAPDAHIPIAANGVSLWVVPAEVSGAWSGPAGASRVADLRLTQRFQMLAGSVRLDGQTRAIREGRVAGERFTLALDGADPANPTVLSGRIANDAIEGSIEEPGRATPWSARRS